jgi:hypothetical protein
MACMQHFDITCIYIGMSGRAEIAVLVSLFSIHTFKLYMQTKLPLLLKIIQSLMSMWWPDFCKQEESE